MTWTTLHLRVVTPLFSGDDPTQPQGAPIRVPSIRGVLRFWFRAVAAGHDITDLAALWRQEQEVFGSTRTPSPIALRVRSQPDTQLTQRPPWAVHAPAPGRRGGGQAAGFHGAQYLLGQGLWNHRDGGVVRPFVPEDTTVELDIRFSRNDTVDARFMVALWAWLTYGGLGARTRRGFGQLACTEVTGDLPGQWSAADLTPPTTVKGWETLGQQALPAGLRGRVEPGWTLLDTDPGEDEHLPEFPTLAPRWWAGRMLAGTADSLGAALHLAGQEWRAFRAVANPRQPITPNTRSPEWVHVIHGKHTVYPIAALGLPVGYFSPARGGRASFKATVEPYLQGTSLRRASPVWLRPVPLGEDRWAVFTHLFWARLVPDNTELRISEDGGNRVLPVPAPDTVEEAWNQWNEDRHRLPKNWP